MLVFARVGNIITNVGPVLLFSTQEIGLSSSYKFARRFYNLISYKYVMLVKTTWVRVAKYQDGTSQCMIIPIIR
jgi:hypothetical protein